MVTYRAAMPTGCGVHLNMVVKASEEPVAEKLANARDPIQHTVREHRIVSVAFRMLVLMCIGAYAFGRLGCYHQHQHQHQLERLHHPTPNLNPLAP